MAASWVKALKHWIHLLINCYPFITSSFNFYLNAVICHLKLSKLSRNENIPTFISEDYFHLCIMQTVTRSNKFVSQRRNLSRLHENWYQNNINQEGKGTKRWPQTIVRLLHFPLTIATIFEQILETFGQNWAIEEQFDNYLESNNLTTKSQFGFRKSMSMVHTIQKLLNNNFKAFGLKTFDTTDHRLIRKYFKFYALNEHTMKHMSYYLTNREWMVKINSANSFVFSYSSRVKAGVQKGSILTSFLFNIFINLPIFLSISVQL